jgi:hypothetical protein
LSHNKRDQKAILSAQLLLNLAEELKVPFLQIARKAELHKTSIKDLNTIQVTAENALRLIDGYALGLRMNLDDSITDFEPVSVSSVLYDAGQQLSSLANEYGVSLELSIAGRYGPVMANREGLQAALVALGASMIEAMPAQGGRQLRLQLATHRSRYGIVAGLYGDNKKLSKDALQKGRKLKMTSRQPLLNVTHTSAAGIFVADALLSAMNLDLTSSRHQGMYGLGTVLQTNHQMQLV